MPVQTVQTFKALLCATHARGSSLNAVLDSAIHNALGYIEANYNLKYMRFQTQINMNQGSTSFLWTGAIANGLKVLREFYGFENNGDKWHLRQITPEQLRSNTGDRPTGFWLNPDLQLDGSVKQLMTFDCPFKEVMTPLTAWGYMYRGWSGNDLDSNVFLINRFEQLVLARCMMQLAPIMRDPQILQMWGSLFQDNVGTLLLAQDEGERGADGSE